MSSFLLFSYKWYINKQGFRSVGQMMPQISDKCYVGQVRRRKTGVTPEKWEPGFLKKHL